MCLHRRTATHTTSSGTHSSLARHALGETHAPPSQRRHCPKELSTGIVRRNCPQAIRRRAGSTGTPTDDDGRHMPSSKPVGGGALAARGVAWCAKPEVAEVPADCSVGARGVTVTRGDGCHAASKRQTRGHHAASMQAASMRGKHASGKHASGVLRLVGQRTRWCVQLAANH